MTQELSVILTTYPNEEEAEKATRELLEQGLAGCIQRISISSSYIWDEKLTVEPEQLLLIKAPAANYRDIELTISASHPYDVPEIIQIPVSRGLQAYLEWLVKVSK